VLCKTRWSALDGYCRALQSARRRCKLARDNHARRLVMAKGQMRSNKEKKKPKQDKNKKDKGGPAPSPFAPGQSQPGANPYGKK
jgi:hypothetical protein